MSAVNVEVEPLNGPSEIEAPDARESELSNDEIFHLLQSRRRRLVLRYLHGTDGEVWMRDVAEQVAAWEHETTVQALTSDERQRVYIPLYQSHLPKLDDAGVIRYDQSRGLVERTARADQLDRYLETVDSTTTDDRKDGDEEEAIHWAATSDRPWPIYYLGVSGIAAVLLAGSLLGVAPLAGASGLVLGVTLAMYWLVVAAHLLDERVAPVPEPEDQ